MVSSTTISSTFSYQKPFRNFPHVFLACHAFRHTAACQKEYNLIMMETMLRTQILFLCLLLLGFCHAATMWKPGSARSLVDSPHHPLCRSGLPAPAAPLTGWFFYIDAQNVYSRRTWFIGYAVVQFLLLGASLIPLIGASRILS